MAVSITVGAGKNYNLSILVFLKVQEIRKSNLIDAL